MTIFKIIGIGLIVLGAVAGFMILLLPFAPIPKGPEHSFWGLFVLCFIGGFTLFALGSERNAVIDMLKTIGSILLILGLMSAAALFLSKVELIKASEDTSSLWGLFFICTVSGALGLLASEDYF